MRRPSKMFDPSPGFIPPGTPKTLPDPSLAPEQYEQMIKNRGLRWRHQKGAPCPNVRDLETSIHDPNCRLCDNGLVFFGGAVIHGLAQQNKLERIYEICGVYDVGQVVITFSAYADDADGNPGKGPAVDLQHFDRLLCLDYESRFQELIEHSPTGIDRLRYPATSVEFVRTADKIYRIDEDFVINGDGYIQWLSNNQPSFDQLNSKGQVYTISYCMNPVFIVTQLLHEIRATKALDQTTGQVMAVRLPQQVLLTRDFMFNHPSDKVALSGQSSPRSGGTINTPD